MFRPFGAAKLLHPYTRRSGARNVEICVYLRNSADDVLCFSISAFQHLPVRSRHPLKLPFSYPYFTMIRLDRITCNPGRMNGQPCLRGLRLTVRRVVEIAALFPDRAERLIEFPEIEDEDIRQALHYAALQLPDGIIPLEPNALVA